VTRRIDVVGAAHLVVVSGATLLHPDVQVFEAMLEGWRRQRVSRHLAMVTIETSLALVRRFQSHAGEFPWQWTPAHLEDWTTDLRAERQLSHSTVRVYQQTVRMFLIYACDPMYGWAAECEKRFGSFPVQICHEWNTSVHRAGVESRPGRRSLTRPELQRLFDAADDAVEEVRRKGRKGFAAAYRDSVMLKTAYAFGLRRNELLQLTVHDFGRNPKAAEFGEFGVCYVRFGKANAGSPPKRRSVLTVMPWSVDVITEWVREVWPQVRHENASSLWPSEAAPRMSDARFNSAFVRLREAAGLPSELSMHCLRHSYVTHLIEDGFDALFVQQQVGHEHASTTSIYTSVSSDYKTRVLRAALDRIIEQATTTTTTERDT
jgi:integrase/recombinase XerC